MFKTVIIHLILETWYWFNAGLLVVGCLFIIFDPGNERTPAFFLTASFTYFLNLISQAIFIRYLKKRANE